MRYSHLLILVAGFILGQQAASSFEVVSLKRGNPDRGTFTAGCYDPRSVMGVIPAGRCIVHNKPVRTMVAIAYDFPLPSADWVKGGPAWVNDENFDLEAKAEDPKTSPADLRRMLQSFLADRFKLRLHEETVDTPQFALVVAKDGAKLKAFEAGERPGVMSTGAPGGGRQMRAHKTSMNGLVSALNSGSAQLGRQVLNRTNLSGEYDFTLSWAPNDQVEGPSIFTALQEQLGLRLESIKAPMRIVVIDSAERPSLQ